MKLLLANPPWSKDRANGERRYGVRAGSRWPYTAPARSAAELPYVPFPFFMAYATAVMEQQERTEVRAFDAIGEGWTQQEYEARLNAFGPDMVVAETATASWPADRMQARRQKYLLPGSLLALAGQHASAQPVQALQECPEAEYCLAGEYEQTLPLLLQAIEKGGGFEDVPGLAWREAGGVRINARPAPVDPDQLPWPAWSHFSMYRYKDYFCNIPGPMVNMLASRGCPYRCSFCVWPRVMYGSHSYRPRNPEDVAAELAHLVTTYEFKTVYFDDDAFNLGKSRLLALCDAIERHGAAANLAVMGRADAMDEECVTRLREVGLIAVKYGVESGDQGLLDRCGKQLDLGKVRKGVALAKAMGVRVHLTFTLGLPGETEETMRRTQELALELAPDSLQVSLATPFPGTPFYDEVKSNGHLLVDGEVLYDGVNACTARTEALTAEQIENGFHAFRRAWDQRQKARA